MKESESSKAFLIFLTISLETLDYINFFIHDMRI